MRSSYLVVVLTVFAIVGCDALNSFMPAPTANKTVSVPADAVIVALDTADGIVLPENSVGDYYFVENDTNNVVLFFTVPIGSSSRAAFDDRRKNQLDIKRKYRVYFELNKASTQPSAMAPAMSTPVAPATAAPANPLAPTPAEHHREAPATVPVM
ncbi:hypothetical protein BH10PLA1_BH10PLA1_22340 [soil metagenome]